MNNRNFFSSLLTAVLMVCLSGAASAESKGQLRSLEGRIFAVEAEIVFSADPAASGFNVGDTFSNCYFFKDNNVWIDPLFPAPGAAVAGGWIQHTRGPSARYTATVVDTVLSGLPLLTQNGRVYLTRRKAKRRLIAYTTAWAGAQPFVEVISKGREIKKKDVASMCPAY